MCSCGQFRYQHALICLIPQLRTIQISACVALFDPPVADNSDNNNALIIIIIIAFKGAIRDFLQSPHSATNCLQHVRSSGPGATCANHVQHIERLSRASVMLRATWYEGTAQLLSLTELKSHLFELYFIGWTIEPMKERCSVWSPGCIHLICGLAVMIIMSVFLEHLSMGNMLNCAEQVQIHKYKTHAYQTLKTAGVQTVMLKHSTKQLTKITSLIRPGCRQGSPTKPSLKSLSYTTRPASQLPSAGTQCGCLLSPDCRSNSQYVREQNTTAVKC